MRSFVRRALRATALLARDASIPKPLRALAAFGLLPLPGPLDEAVLLLVAPVFAVLYRSRMRAAWAGAEAASPPPAPG